MLEISHSNSVFARIVSLSLNQPYFRTGKGTGTQVARTQVEDPKGLSYSSSACLALRRGGDCWGKVNFNCSSRVSDPAAGLRTVEAFTRVNWPGRNPCWRDILGFRGQFEVDSPPGQWTRIEVEVREGNFTCRVNGQLVNEAQECNYTEGRILLQTEAAEIHFRKVDLEPLERP